MSALCFAHAEKAHARDQVLGNVARNRGTCIEPGRQGMALYVLHIEGPRPQPEATPEMLEEPSIPARGEPAPTVKKQIERAEEPRSIPCDRTPTCPHCLLASFTRGSASYIPNNRTVRSDPKSEGRSCRPTPDHAAEMVECHQTQKFV